MRRIALTVLGAVALTAVLGRAVQPAPVGEIACRGDGTRVALLIGNQDYVGTMQPLDNPRRDITALGALLCQHGFTVFRHSDLDVPSFDTTVENFARAARGTKTALVYYSGHGFAMGRRNWLVPVDARLGCEDLSEDGDVPTRVERRLVDLDKDVLSRLDGASDQIVILDACRTDPVKGCRGGATPSLIKGLVRTSTSNARLIVYATQDGQVALDRIRGSDTSPMIAAMLKRLPENPRRDWVTAMLAVSAEVHVLTDRKQRPNIDVSLAPQGCLAPECGAVAQPVPQPVSEAAQAWSIIQTTTSLAVLEDFIRQFDNTPYGSMARARLEELKKNQVVVVTPPVSPPTARPPEVPTPALGLPAIPSIPAPRPVTSGPAVSWKLQTAYTEKTQTSMPRFAGRIDELSGRRFKIGVLPVGSVVPLFQILDAVHSGVLDAGFVQGDYYYGKIPAMSFMASIPFGFTPREHLAFRQRPEVKSLFDRVLDVNKLNVVAMPCGSFARPGFGWFKRTLSSTSDLRGLKFVTLGLAAEIFREVGSAATIMSTGEIIPAMERGVIDAAHSLSPMLDRELGFQNVAKYFYHSGVVKPTRLVDLLVNKAKWNGLPRSYQQLFEFACQEATVAMLGEYEELDRNALRELADRDRVSVVGLPASVERDLYTASRKVLEAHSGKNAWVREVLAIVERLRPSTLAAKFH